MAHPAEPEELVHTEVSRARPHDDLAFVLADHLGFPDDARQGFIVAVFQFGWLDRLVGVTHTGPITPLVPILMFAVLFGLSMDYEVFLVSRMHEEWLKLRDNNAAVRIGQAITGRTITAAAAIMIVVFSSFVITGVGEESSSRWR